MRVLADILAAADVQAGERVLEVGPGEGVLTRPLVDAVGQEGEVVAVEYDAGLAKALRIGAPANLRIVHADAVQADLEGLGPFDRIVSNLPYQISGPVTSRFLDTLPSWRRAVLLVQKEFADRLHALPRTGDYGRLGVHVQRHCHVRRLRTVAPGSFAPPPRVDSAVVVLEPHAEAPFEVMDERLWRAVVDGTFQNRRKQLRNTLPPAVAGLVGRTTARDTLGRLGWSACRPEELAPADFGALVAALREAP